MPKFDADPTNVAALRSRLLDWYARNRRDLPWRQSADPYAIWVSEIMLQQTRVAVVVERYQMFMARFPTLVSLALADGAGGAGAVERPGLLSARAHAAQGGAVCGRAFRGQSAGARGATARSARHRRLHGGGDCQHRSRRAGSGCGRQRGARAVPRGRMGGGQPQRRRRSTAAQD